MSASARGKSKSENHRTLVAWTMPTLRLAEDESRGTVTLIGQDEAVSDEASLNERVDWTTLAGPAVLGRSLLLAPGVATPAPWAEATRIELNDRTIGDPAMLYSIRHAYLGRVPMVYQVDPGMVIPARGSDSREVWEAPPDADFVAEAAWRLAIANSVDGRDADFPRWPLAAMAVGAGAMTAIGRFADVVLA